MLYDVIKYKVASSSPVDLVMRMRKLPIARWTSNDEKREVSGDFLHLAPAVPILLPRSVRHTCGYALTCLLLCVIVLQKSRTFDWPTEPMGISWDGLSCW